MTQLTRMMPLRVPFLRATFVHPGRSLSTSLINRKSDLDYHPAPGWDERQATESEADIKADLQQLDEAKPTAELQAATVRHTKRSEEMKRMHDARESTNVTNSEEAVRADSGHQ